MNTETILTPAPLFKKGQKVLATRGVQAYGGHILMVITINGKPNSYVVEHLAGFHETYNEDQIKIAS